MKPIQILDPVPVVSEEMRKHPHPAEEASNILRDVQMQLQRCMFQLPRLDEMEFHVFSPRKARVTMQVTYRVTGKILKRKLELVIDGRQVEKARLDGKVVMTPLLAHEAVLKIVADINR